MLILYGVGCLSRWHYIRLNAMPNSNQPLPSGPVTIDTPIKFIAELPEEVEVCIIGGGIIGVSTALYLAEQGKRVLLCEKGRIAGEQSSRNWGWVRQQGRDAAELPLMMESNRIWQGLEKRCSSAALHFEQQGIWYLAKNKSDMARYEKFLAIAQAHGLRTRLLTRNEVEKQFPNSQGNWCGGMTTASDGRVEAWEAIPAMAVAAEKAGAIIIEHCAVRSLQTESEQVSSVITEAGSVRVQQVVLAGGVWSSLFVRNLGIRLPQLAVRANVAKVDGVPSGFNGNALDNELAFRRRNDGGYNLALCDHHNYDVGPDTFRYLLDFRKAIGLVLHDTHLHPRAPSGFPDAWGTPRRWSTNASTPFEKMRVLNPIPDPELAEIMRKRLIARFPALKNVQLKQRWAGMIDAMPDFVPVIDQAPGIPGFWIATGFSGHGFGIGPVVGRILSDLLQGRSAGHDMTRFRFDRFSDGSPIVPGPAL